MRPVARILAMAVAAAAIVFTNGCSGFGESVGGDATHGQIVAKAHCASCHGDDGNSTVAVYPRLAGQKADYLYRQLSGFKDGTRPSTVMTAIVAPRSDGDLRDAAVFFAGQARGSDPPGPPARMAQGRQLFLFGSPDGNVPACAACHASGVKGMRGMGHMGGGIGMGMGSMPMMGMLGRRAPTLYGQHAAYVISQLQAFANGSRPATTMDRVAGSMTAQQVQAVADYVAAHP